MCVEIESVNLQIKVSVLHKFAQVKNELSAQETAARRFADESNKKAGKIFIIYLVTIQNY